MVLLHGEERIMSFLSTHVGLVRVVGVTIGMTACVKFTSLPSSLHADAQQIEYRTSAFTVRAPHGRWATDSVMRVRHFRVVLLPECEILGSPYDPIVLAGVVDPAVFSGVIGAGLDVQQIRFFRVVKMQYVPENLALLSDADACITVTSYPLIRYDSSAALLDFFQTLQTNDPRLAPFHCFRGRHSYSRVVDVVGRFRLQNIRVGERTFYEMGMVPVADSTTFCMEYGVELLYVAQGKVFAVYVSSAWRLADALPVAESLTPRE